MIILGTENTHIWALLDLRLREGIFHLWRLLDMPEAAHPGKRDVAPLRLNSRLTCGMDVHAHSLIEETMQTSDNILAMGRYHLSL